MSTPPAVFANPEKPVNFPLSRQGEGNGKPLRILIHQVGLFGEVLMATPLLPALREAYPDAHITWVIDPIYRNVVDASPYLDSLLLWDTKAWRQLRKRNPLFWLYQLYRTLREVSQAEGGWDIYISFLPEKWGSLARSMKSRHRIGVFDTHWDFFGQTETSKNTRHYTRAFTRAELPEHRTDMYLLPLTELGIPLPREKAMTLGFTQDDAAVVEAFLQAQGVQPHEKLVLVAPTTTWESRCWPVESYIALGNRLTQEDPQVRLVLLGRPTPEEKAILEPILAGWRGATVSAVGALSFRQMAALTARGSLMISGDTGTMHVAAAVGTPYLAFFGPTPAEGRRPLFGAGRALEHPLPCAPCESKTCKFTGAEERKCLRAIGVDEALQAVRSLLQEASATPQ